MKWVRACINFEFFFDLKLLFHTVLFMDIEKVLIWKAERLLSQKLLYRAIYTPKSLRSNLLVKLVVNDTYYRGKIEASLVPRISTKMKCGWKPLSLHNDE